MLTEPRNWRHVKSLDNPADLITRGTEVHILATSELWWHGPAFLKTSESEWPPNNFSNEYDDGLAEHRKVVCYIEVDHHLNLIHRFSSFSRLKRVFAYILRFCRNIKLRREERSLGVLDCAELEESETNLIKIAQNQSFSNEMGQLSKGKTITNKGLLSLNPFVDKQGIMRVGGRVQRGDFSIEKIHPIILPRHHRLSYLIAKHIHTSRFHCGPQALLSALREKYWPIRGRNLSKAIFRDCIVCFKARPKPQQYLMAPLPKERLVAQYPFENTGIDFAGPFLIRDKTTRKYNLIKHYVAIFICLLTKAIHLEVVSDLSADNFISCFRRFVARRGKPRIVMSDNGKNFIGADAKLKDLSNFLFQNQGKIVEAIHNEGVQWKFIPPRAPNFGGIWEAGVKSFKFHFCRVAANSVLNLEQFQTIIVQIEGILNSRPLYPLSTDPNDPHPLTPFHFMIGRMISYLPDQTVYNIPDNRLSVYQRLQKLIQGFWKRWSKDYIAELQSRTRWQKNQSNLQMGDMVLLLDENSPPASWILGRITEVYPGGDGVVRVVKVKCAMGEYKRSVSKVRLLPKPVES